MRGGSWRPSPLLQASAVAHVAAVAGAIADPGFWGAAAGVIVADHALLTAAGLWPRSRLLGPNMTHLSGEAAARGEVAVTIDDGPDPEVTPEVLDLLDARGARASFFCIGERAVRHPALVREMVARGHSIENHTYHHDHHFATFGPRRIHRELARAQDCLAQLTGRSPRFFRAVAGLRNPFLDPVLHRLDLRLATWTRRAFDTRRRDPARALDLLTQNLAAGDILDLHDGNAALSIYGRPMILDVLPGLLERIAQAKLNAALLGGASDASGTVPVR